MTSDRHGLGTLGSRFFSLIQARKQSLVKLCDLQKPLNLSPSQEQSLLKRLASNGYIIRLQRGCYLAPQKLPPGGAWRPNDYFIIDQFMKLHNAQYYIGGLSAVYHHGLIQQIVNLFTVYNDQVSGRKTFGKLQVLFIKVSTTNISGYSTETIPNNGTCNIATLPRTILDLLQHWSRFHLVEEAYSWIEKYHQDENFLVEFIELVANNANNSTVRRIGYFLEKLNIGQDKLSPLLSLLTTKKNYLLLYPNISTLGKNNKKWMVSDNGKQNF